MLQSLSVKQEGSSQRSKLGALHVFHHMVGTISVRAPINLELTSCMKRIEPDCTTKRRYYLYASRLTSYVLECYGPVDHYVGTHREVRADIKALRMR